MGRNIYDEGTYQISLAQIVNADGTTLKQLASSQFPDLRIDNILLTSSDTVTRVVDFWYNLSGVNYLIGSVSVPAGAGYAGVAAVDAMATLLLIGQIGLPMNSSAVLNWAVETTVTAAKVVQAVVLGGRF